MNKRYYLFTACILFFVALVLAGMAMPVAQAAPLAAPTPVSVTRPENARGPLLLKPFNNTVLTADTTATCQDIGDYSIADVIYQVDQGTTNTITLTPKWSNDGSLLALGAAAVSANAADATEAIQIPLYGKYLCLYADVTNANPVTVTFEVLLK